MLYVELASRCQNNLSFVPLQCDTDHRFSCAVFMKSGFSEGPVSLPKNGADVVAIYQEWQSCKCLYYRCCAKSSETSR